MKKGIRQKVRKGMIIVTACTILLVSGAFSNAFVSIFRSVSSRDEKLEETLGDLSLDTVNSYIRKTMIESAINEADYANDFFGETIEDIQVIADATAMVYENEDDYPDRDIPLPDPANDGTISVQLTFTEGTDDQDENIRKEVILLGNVQDLLLAVIGGNDQAAAGCIATESGIMIWADRISGKKVDENGRYFRYDPDRPWYTGAKESGGPWFSLLTHDRLSDQYGIICSTPVYCEGKLMGVVCATMYLDTVIRMMNEKDVGRFTQKCIIDRNGRVIFSTFTEGVLAAGMDGADMRETEEPSLSDIVTDAMSGGTNVNMALVDGEAYYISYAPIYSTGWTFLMLVPMDEAIAPTRQLMQAIDDISDETEQEVNRILTRNIVILIGLIFLVVLMVMIAVVHLSRYIADPINKLTQKVSAIKGDTLDFVWDKDTEDETQLLAVSFQDLVGRIKQYISEVQTVTAEKEKISAELNVAAKIQADMLPRRFPPFPDRHEFDIYASMTPAKEVGGDFYDFFLIDQDHLAIVMADVSEKGVPAALFMVISKTLIKNQAQMCQSPGIILEEVNRKLCEGNEEGMFVTVWLGIMEISTGRIVAANAGHEYPVVCGKNGTFELLHDEHEMMLGLMDDLSCKEYEIRLKPGDTLFLYTDGVPEATNARREFFGMNRMLDALNRDPQADPEQLLSHVKASVDEFVGDAPQFDDLTMLALRRKAD